MTKETLRRYGVSALTTFLSIFFTTVGVELASGHMEFTSAFLLSLLGVAIRAAFKGVVEAIPTLGGHADK